MDKLQDIISKVETLTVVELAELIKVMEEKFGVSAAMPMAAGGAAAGEAEEKTAWNVLLKAAGDQKINVIKAVREITGLGLKEAKDIVDAAPKVVKEGVKKEEAEEFKQKLAPSSGTVGGNEYPHPVRTSPPVSRRPCFGGRGGHLLGAASSRQVPGGQVPLGQDTPAA